MDKKWILLLLVAGVAGYFIWKKNKKNNTAEDNEEDYYSASDYKEPVKAEKYEEVELEETLTASQRANMTPEEIEEAEERERQRQELNKIRAEYYAIFKENMPAQYNTVEKAQIYKDQQIKMKEILDAYISLTGDQEATLKDARYDEESEIIALTEAYYKAKEYVDLGGKYSDTKGLNKSQIQTLINELKLTKEYVALGGSAAETKGLDEAGIKELIKAKENQLTIEWTKTSEKARKVKDQLSTYLIKDITYKNNEKNIKPIQDFLSGANESLRAYFIAFVNEGGNVQIKYDSKQFKFKTLKEAVDNILKNKSFSTHKKAGAFLQTLKTYATQYNDVKLSDFDKYGRKIK